MNHDIIKHKGKEYCTDCVGIVKSVFSMSHDNKWYHVVQDLKGEPLGDYRLGQLKVINKRGDL